MAVSSGAPLADLLRVAIEAAVSAAIANKAPRRTVAAAAGSVASAFLAANRCSDSALGGFVAPDGAPARRRKKKKRNRKAKAAEAKGTPNKDDQTTAAPSVNAGAAVNDEPMHPVHQARLDDNVLAQVGSSPASLPPNSPISTARSDVSALSALGLQPRRQTVQNEYSVPVPQSPGSLDDGMDIDMRTPGNSARPPGTKASATVSGGRHSKS